MTYEALCDDIKTYAEALRSAAQGKTEANVSGVLVAQALLGIVGRSGTKRVDKIGILRVDDEGAEHYEEISLDDISEHGRWTQTVTEITILEKS